MQASLEGESSSWLEETKALMAELPEEPLAALPENVLAVLSLDPLVVALAVYVHLGFVLLYHLCLRSVRELRAQLVSLESRYESSLRKQKVRLAGLEGRLETTPETPPLAAETAQPAALSKRQRVVEMVRQGANPTWIADHLDLSPAEVDLLLRMSRLERHGTNGPIDRDPTVSGVS